MKSNRGLSIRVFVVPVSDSEEDEWLPALTEAGLAVVGLDAMIPWPDKRPFIVRIYDEADNLVQQIDVNGHQEGERIRDEIYDRAEGMSSDEIERFNANRLWNVGGS